MLIKLKYFHNITLSRKLALCSILHMLSSCSMQAPYSMENIEISQEVSSPFIPGETKNIMLLAEQEQNIESKNNYYIYAINSLMSKKQLPKVSALWAQVEKESLTTHQTIAIEILKAKYLLLQHNNKQALTKLIHLAKNNTLTTKEAKTIYNLLSTTYKNNNDLTNFIIYHLKADKLDNDNDNKSFLTSLAENSLQSLQTSISNTNDTDAKGWLELAILAQTKLEQTEVEQWQQNYPDHRGNDLIIAKSNYKTANIALMLPLKGELAKTSNSILQGFFAEYYQNKAQNINPNVIVVDTSESSFNSELKKLVKNNMPDIIIGPITKEEVDTIDSSIAPKSLIIALNNSDSTSADNIIHFSLSPQDETNKVASDVFNKGIHHALIFASEEPWQQKTAEQFSQTWQDLTGQVTLQAVNNLTPLSVQLKSSLNIDVSENKAKKLEQIIDEKLKFIPSRRTDIDMIFLATSSRQARQIKPLLKYYFAGDIPVYSTSTIFNTASNSYKDVDLNDILFCDSDWIVTNSPKDQTGRALQKLWPKDFNTHKRLFALGVDTAKIVANINTLNSIDGSIIKGHTGELSLEDNNILRKLQWFKFQQGTPKLTSNY